MENNSSPYNNCIAHTMPIQNTFYAESELDIVNALKQVKSKSGKLYTISTGNNWGYGAKSPITKDNYLLNLSKMNRILFFDVKMGLLKLEPGVTYGQLSDFLKQNGDAWLTPVHGGGPNCSVVANCLERGFGITPITDHFQSVMSLRAILADTSIYESAYSSMEQSGVCNSFKWGIGPYLDGIFTQSNYGIVTNLTIQLAPKQDYHKLFLVKIKNAAQLPEIVENISSLYRDYGSYLSGLNLMNQERLISMIEKYPTEKKSTSTSLNEEEILNFSKKLNLKPWAIVFSISGKKEIVDSISRYVKKHIKPASAQTVTIDKKKLRILKFLGRYFDSIQGIPLKSTFESLNGLFEILDGTPNNTALNLAYWMNETSIEERAKPLPDYDSCGLIWYSPIIPMNPEIVEKFNANCRLLSKEYGFNPLLTFTVFNRLSLECTFPILFNQKQLLVAAKAKEFYIRLLLENAKIGCYPYRLPNFAMEELKKHKHSDFFRLAKNLKLSLDPEEILSPDRYVFT